MIYSKKLRELREEKQIKQKDIANFLNISKTAYCQYENEYIIIPIKHLNSVCNFFNISIDYLFDLTNKTNYKNNLKTVDKITCGQRIKLFRKEFNLTQIKLANDLNIGKGTIADYERGRYLIATPFLYTICKKYNISADYLLGKIDNPKYLKQSNTGNK